MSTEDQQQATGTQWTRQFTVATILLGAFLVLVGVMLWKADSGTETIWQRRVYLFGGVEAIVFTAVGWLFGSEVHRAEAQTAKKDAADAKKEAEQARGEAKEQASAAAEADKQLTAEQERAQTAAAVVRHTTVPGPADPQPRGGDISFGDDPTPTPQPATVDLRALFDELYPPR